ncbi:hypothetical protein [Streptomyces sp. NPDC003327]
MVLKRRAAALAAAAVLVLTPVAAGCSDDEATPGDRATSVLPPAPTTEAPGADESPDAGESPETGDSPGAGEPDDPDAAEDEITRNWTAFFDPKTPVDQKVRLLEDGERMRPVVTAFAGDKNAAMTSAKVTDVEFTSATGADVAYDLLVGGNPALPDSRGTSVLQDDTWKVSVKTLCGLVELSGVTVQGC